MSDGNAELRERIEQLVRDLADDVSAKVIANLHDQGIFDVIGEREFRAIALVEARKAVIRELSERVNQPPALNRAGG